MKTTDDVFRNWIRTRSAELLLPLTQVWQQDQSKTVDKLRELFYLGANVTQPRIDELEARVRGLEMALQAKQNIEVNFSLFRRKP